MILLVDKSTGQAFVPAISFPQGYCRRRGCGHRQAVQLKAILQAQQWPMQDSAPAPQTSDLFANKKEKETLMFLIVSEDSSCSWNLCLKFLCGLILDHILLSTLY